MARLREIFQFFGRGMWRIRLHELSPARSFLLRVVRILVLSVREFQRDKCSLRASALTYYTLLAIVPVLAMAFGIAKGFGMEEKLETAIRSKLVWESDADVTGETAAMLGEGGTQALSGAKQGLAQVADYAIKFANNMLEGVKGGWVAGIGVLLLFWIIIKTLGNIEKSFNDIWGVRKSRSWPRKFSDYLAFMVISPVVFVMAGSLTGVVVARGAQLVERFAVWGWMDGAGLFRAAYPADEPYLAAIRFHVSVHAQYEGPAAFGIARGHRGGHAFSAYPGALSAFSDRHNEV